MRLINENEESSLKNGSNARVDKLIDKVSNAVSRSSHKKHDAMRIPVFGEKVAYSNVDEISEASAKVWRKEQINMKDTIGNLMENLSSSIESKGALDQIKMLEEKNRNKGKILELLSPNKQQKIERRTQYESTQKEMKHWGPTIDRINKQETISYGESEKIDIISTAHLATNYKPLDEFEQEFDNVLREINKEYLQDVGPLDSSEISPCDRIKKQSEKNFVKKLKFILFQQQKENKRLKKIKSKTWRKNYRKQMEVEEEKLLSLGEAEYPELVKKIRERYEEKRAKIRLMRRQTARQKWAKAALRFGGRELQRSISDQAQKQHEEKKRIEQIIQNTSSDLNEDEFNHSDQDVESIQQSIEGARKDIKDLKNASSGLFDLKFIQRGIETNNNLLDLELNEIEQENNLDGTITKDSNTHISDCISNEMINLSKPSEKEIIEANDEAQYSLHLSQDINYLSCSPSKTPQFEYTKSSKDEKVVFDIHKSDKEALRNKAHLNIEDELEKMANMDMKGNHESYQANSMLLKHIFIEGGEDYQTNDSDNLKNTKVSMKSKAVPGWGNWCSSIPGSSEFNSSSNAVEKLKPMINPNRSIDKKISKYCVSQAPHPFNSNELYESTLKHPIGPEWNTTAIHNKLIQPKIQTRIGAVIKPLVYSKHLKNIQISDSFLEKWNRVKKCNRTKARF
ncbi:putative coiled coil protein [Cryptosporidium canis]|uniref:Coiled coil protein n=1 Tax=Cryptosporidium canis TaxID=195482 RepID=A0A9D5DE96_9CRYT|nr:putative coiled coil protein [Cryptosporidium canis]